MICDQCGRKNNDDSSSCENCGSPLEAHKSGEDNLPGFLKSEWLGITQVLPRLLYIGAIIAVAISLFVAIYAATLQDSSSIISTTISVIGILANGLFCAGTLTGLAGVISTQKDAKHAQRQCKILYIAAGSLLLIGITVAALYMFQSSSSTTSSTSSRVYLALYWFLALGLFESGILAGLAALNSPRQESDTRDHNPMVKVLYLAAAATLILAIIVASLSATVMSEGWPLLEKTSSFLSSFSYCGILYGGILAALGKLVYLRSHRKKEPVSTDKEREGEGNARVNGPAAT
jgi:uncharacterized membrane protein